MALLFKLLRFVRDGSMRQDIVLSSTDVRTLLPSHCMPAAGRTPGCWHYLTRLETVHGEYAASSACIHADVTQYLHL